MTDAPKRKLIEVGVPLKTINEESAREKSIRQGHPSTIHLWWSRKPLAAARAVLFAQLVDDPSSHPDQFPTDQDIVLERKRLHGLIEQLAVWENSTDVELLAQAHAEILKSTGGAPPTVLDPFAGGGSIPLEAQRLGLSAFASDLNPVAVLINKAVIEIPPKFAGKSPVWPGIACEQLAHPWPGATGLGEDVRRYGQWMRDEAQRRIGHIYPKATLPDGSAAQVLAWLWARTVTCPNPACRIEMPLVQSWWLGKKKGNESYVIPSVIADISHPSGRSIRFTIGHDPRSGPSSENDGTMNRGNATCVACNSSAPSTYLREQAVKVGLGQRLMALVIGGARGRRYISPTADDERAAQVERPSSVPDQLVPTPNHDVDRLPMYGMPRWSDAFTNRQLVTLTALCDLVSEARERVLMDALGSGMPEGDRLEAGGDGAAAYADAVATYMGLGVSRTADLGNSLVTWSNSRDQARNLFSRQAIQMAWGFVEICPFADAAGDVAVATRSMGGALDRLQPSQPGVAVQANARDLPFEGMVICTDPPYYDNIGYSDLSDFFYVWLRRSLISVHPALLSTVLVPKSEELVANPYRNGGKDGAQQFFEDGFREVFVRARTVATPEFPITVFYAFKQSETVDGDEVSTGWETLLEGMIAAGWSVTATWPLRSERGGRMLSIGTNALASSILLSLRPREVDAPRTDRRRLIAALKAELPAALKALQQGAIAPVDLPQAAIGPGMAVFSRYSAVLEDDGSKMPVRAALARINEVLDEVLTEQEGDFDPDTRFAIAWFRQFGFDPGPYGDADNIARARNASIDHLDRSGILMSRAGRVTLRAPDSLNANYDPATDPLISTWEVVMHLTRVLAAEGIPAAAALLSRVPASIERDLCKELAFLMFSISEARKQTKLAVEFNALGTAWNEIAAGASRAAAQPVQSTIEFEGD